MTGWPGWPAVTARSGSPGNIAGELLRVDPATGAVQHSFDNLQRRLCGRVRGRRSVGRHLRQRGADRRRDEHRHDRAAAATDRRAHSRRRLRVGLERGKGHRLQDRPVRPDRRHLRDRRRGQADVLRRRDALGRQPGRRHGDRNRRDNGRHANPALRPPPRVSRGAARKTARRGQSGAHLRGSNQRTEGQGGAPDEPHLRIRSS